MEKRLMVAGDADGRGVIIGPEMDRTDAALARLDQPAGREAAFFRVDYSFGRFDHQLDADGASFNACLFLNSFQVRTQLLDLAAAGDLWQCDDEIFRNRAA